MMPYARPGLFGEEVSGRCAKEFHHRLVFKRRRIRHINDDRGILQNLGESFTGDGVDSRIERGWHSVVAVGSQFLDNL